MDQTNVVVTPEDVLVYVPNIIGYSRVVFTLLSLFLMMGFPQLWLVATFLYIASFVGDLFGKWTKRTIQQIKTTKQTRQKKEGKVKEGMDGTGRDRNVKMETIGTRNLKE